MILKSFNHEVPEGFEVPTHVDIWYDKHLRLWTLQVKDKYDNQVNDVKYAYGKNAAIETKKQLEIEYNL